MAVTNADILGWLNANPGASDALIAQTMQEAGVSPTRLAEVTGAPVAEVVNRYQAAIAAPVAPTVAPPVAPTNPAVTNADILGWFNANPNADATLVNQTMQAAGVSPSQVASALTASPEIAKTYLTQQILGQGTTEKWTGQGKGSPQANAADMASILSGIGITDISQFGKITKEVPTYSYDENGNETQTGTQTVTTYGNKVTGQAVPNTYSERQTGNAFGGTFQGSGNTGYRVEFDAQGNPLFYTTGASSSNVPSWVKPALILGGAYLGLNAAGLLGGAAPAAGATAITAAEAAGLGLTAAEAASLGLSASEFAAAGGAVAGMGAGTGLTLSGAGGLGGAAGVPSLGGSLGTGLTAASAGGLGGATGAAGFGGALGTGVGVGVGGMAAANSLFGNAALGSTLAGLSTGVGASVLGSTLGGLATGVGAGALGSAVGSALGGGAASSLPAALANAGVSTAINKIIGGGGTSNIPNLISGGLGTAGNLLQQQESKEAAQRAQARIDAETAAAKASAAFRPVGMTTRFGTSQFQVDPVTGQLTSAGYTLSPEAKAQQDRFMALSNLGLTQAEQAPTQFAPLQTGATSLFTLGNKYLAQTPDDVARNYLAQQMSLLQPGRELEFANLQTKLRNQGRLGLSVAQGGDYGATTPELQALFNARARQEAELAANAELAGQRNVMFGANLLDQGSKTMGQYYSGQQGSYAPYTTAMGQVQSLEALGQQPFNMSNALAQQTSTAGARVGQLGLTGAQLSTNLATSANATANPYAQALMAAGNPNTQFGSAIGGLLGGGLQSIFSQTPVSLPALDAGMGVYPNTGNIGLYL